MSLVFLIFLLLAIYVALRAFGVDFTRLASVGWTTILRVILAILVGIAICYLASFAGLVVGIIGLVVGLAVGAFLPNIFSYVWRIATWWAKLLLVITILAALVAAIF